VAGERARGGGGGGDLVSCKGELHGRTVTSQLVGQFQFSTAFDTSLPAPWNQSTGGGERTPSREPGKKATRGAGNRGDRPTQVSARPTTAAAAATPPPPLAAATCPRPLVCRPHFRQPAHRKETKTSPLRREAREEGCPADSACTSNYPRAAQLPPSPPPPTPSNTRVAATAHHPSPTPPKPDDDRGARRPFPVGPARPCSSTCPTSFASRCWAGWPPRTSPRSRGRGEGARRRWRRPRS
jgi:hypothetical protein